jgi:hypothetical protein
MSVKGSHPPGIGLRLHAAIAASEIALILVIGSLAVFGFIRVLPLLVRIPEQVDFAAYYLAAQVLNSDRPLYDPIEMDEAAIRSGGINHTSYIYPPFLAALLRPLATLPYSPARTLWFGLNLGFLLASIGLLARLIGLPLVVAVPVTLATALLPAVYYTLLFGQVNFLLLLLLTGSLYLSSLSQLTRWREITAGVLLGIAVAIKLYPAILGFAFLLRRRLVAVVSMVLGVLAMLVFGVVGGNGWDNTIRYFSEGLSAFVGRGDFPTNQSIQAVLARLFSVSQYHFSVLSPDNYVTITVNPLINAPQIGSLLAYIGAGFIAISTICVLAIRVRHALEGSSLLPDYALLVTAALLITPLVWDNYYVLLLIPIFALLRYYRQSPRRSIRMALLLALLFLVLQRYWRWLSQFVASPWLLAFGFLGTLTLWLTLLCQVPISSREWSHDENRR